MQQWTCKKQVFFLVLIKKKKKSEDYSLINYFEG